LIGAPEVGYVRFDVAQIVAFFAVRQVLFDRVRIVVVKGNPLQNILRCVLKDNNCCFDGFDYAPIGVHEPTRRQGDDTISALRPRENVFKGLCRFHVIGVLRKKALSEVRDGDPEGTFNLCV
jgi:hypothetical protein